MWQSGPRMRLTPLEPLPRSLLSAGNLLTRVTWGGCAGRAIMDLNMDKTTSIYFSSYMLKTQRPAGKQAQGLCRIDNSSPLLQYWQHFIPPKWIHQHFSLAPAPYGRLCCETQTVRNITCLSLHTHFEIELMQFLSHLYKYLKQMHLVYDIFAADIVKYVKIICWIYQTLLW